MHIIHKVPRSWLYQLKRRRNNERASQFTFCRRRRASWKTHDLINTFHKRQRTPLHSDRQYISAEAQTELRSGGSVAVLWRFSGVRLLNPERAGNTSFCSVSFPQAIARRIGRTSRHRRFNTRGKKIALDFISKRGIPVNENNFMSKLDENNGGKK